MSADTTVRAVCGRVASRNSLFETTVSIFRSTVVSIWPKATCALAPLTALHHADHILSGHADFTRPPPRAVSEPRRGRPRPPALAPLRLAFFTPLTAALDTFDLAGDLGVLVRRVGLRHRVAEIVQFAARKARQFLSACASRIVLIVFSICLLASAISRWASCLAFFRISCRSDLIFASCSA